ncbi:hypothetical protein [Aeromonas bestiarum]|uniref:hypothetical protein n=1 Tax=Aeromonas bestiarum TaxID=105751 RepID=UPI00050439C6|nr:hypothetical protein [Aeromonas bestiarum]KFN18465.1 hypothetical protein JM66_15220 [Aeromonas bestiarum]
MTEKGKTFDRLFKSFIPAFDGVSEGALRMALILTEWYHPADGKANPFTVRVCLADWETRCRELAIAGERLPSMPHDLVAAMFDLNRRVLEGATFKGKTLVKLKDLTRGIEFFSWIAQALAAGLSKGDAYEMAAYAAKSHRDRTSWRRIEEVVQKINKDYPSLLEQIVDVRKANIELWREDWEADKACWKSAKERNPFIAERGRGD